MNKPVKPNQKEPKRTITLKQSINLNGIKTNEGWLRDSKYSLEAIVSIWNKALKDHELQGHRITEKPVISSGYIEYTIEFDNPHYSDEMACYSAALNEYAEDCRKYDQYLAKQKQHELELTEAALDNKIARLEERLANLKAIRAGAKFVNGKLVVPANEVV